MSTKIYEAWKFPPTMTLAELMPRLIAARKELLVQIKRQLRNLAKPDNEGRYPAEEERALLLKAYLSGTRDARNMQCSFVVMVHPEIEGILLRVFGVADILYSNDGKRYRAFIAKLTEDARDWHYQNQVDRDEGISEEEWTQRESEWDKLMEWGSTPAEHGLTYPVYELYQAQTIAWDIAMDERREREAAKAVQ